MTQDLHALLAAYEATLVADDDCRDVVNAAVKNVTAVQRRLGSTVQMAHQISDSDDIADLCARGRQTMAGLPELWADIHNKLNGRHPEAYVHGRVSPFAPAMADDRLDFGICGGIKSLTL